MDTGTEALLIVDPDPGMVDVLTAHLMSRGYVIHTSHDREHASRLAGRHRYSAFILGLSQTDADLSYAVISGTICDSALRLSWSRSRRPWRPNSKRSGTVRTTTW
jgi:hypothetical protein